MNKEEKTVGWDAIDAALKTIYPEDEPKHYAPMIPYSLGGDEPLNGISVYERIEPIPHWHYVTYGFSELFEKESENPAVSGYGFEFTFRLKKEAVHSEPPMWVSHFLNNLARYVFSSGNVFEVGHHMNLNGPIVVDEETEIQAITFVDDPELKPINTPNGRLAFLQIVGITLDEETAIKAWNSQNVMDLLLPYLPRYMTDISRTSLMEHDEVKHAVRQGIEKDGSSTAALIVDSMKWKKQRKFFGNSTYEVTLGAYKVGTIAQVIKGRLPKGKSLWLQCEDQYVKFLPAEKNAVEVRDGILQVKMEPQCFDSFLHYLIPKESTFDLPEFKGIQFKIIKSYIKNHEGEVIEVIG
ncbi:suppressor of fused domain protein [Marininema halotolerans]|uniref:Suppressor of fused protein (SUFU) n=1 Tax=Marininema halotolerans TaxID=1155944 RepID=A0A1I6PQA7_9BACL|nr:suppressor of fused domain protein [Marininema halotolerans]SFS42225.1 Suppressor of fused protein (SUFU) [Marininema halotolerans]